MPDVSATLQAFESFSKERASKDPPWLGPIRKQAISRFSQKGFPTTRDEEWKYTNVEPILKNRFQFDGDRSLDGFKVKELERFRFDPYWTNLTFVDGVFNPGLSHGSDEGIKLQAKSLAEAFKTHPDVFKQYLANVVTPEADGFVAINTGFFCDGAFICLPEGAKLEKPIHLLFVTTAKGQGRISQPRNFILLGPGARSKVIESYVSLVSEPYFTNTVSEIVLEEDARLEHYKIQAEDENAFHIASTRVQLEKRSLFESFSLAVGSRIARNALRVKLDGEESECLLTGLYLTREGQHMDSHTLIEHAKPEGRSHQLYKGILQGRSRGVFSGKIIVHKNAQKTDAHQVNKNLLLSDSATVDTKPQLEIFADDVKCTHGAAVGQLDPDAIFYLKSRGMDEASARNLLTKAFANEVIDSVMLPELRSELDRLVWQKLSPKGPGPL